LFPHPFMAPQKKGFLLSLFACAAAAFDYDVLIFGASSAGVAAAITASANGTRSVALVEPLPLAGGMLSAGGLYLTDQLDPRYSRFFVSGVAREWADRVRAGGGGRDARRAAVHLRAHGLRTAGRSARRRGHHSLRDAYLPPFAAHRPCFCGCQLRG
jgi:2-polyprenyl-6-methoxyphenol hydroxylase-like FAD-dependent oxidoreductase